MRVVMPSLHYGDFAAVTLPAWRQWVPEADITLVTAPDDADSIAAAAAAGVRCHVTRAWTADGAVLNKGLALDEAFGFAPGFTTPPADDTCCLSIDADVYPCGAVPSDATIARDTLYGCARYHCASPAALAQYCAGETGRADLALIPPRVRGESDPQQLAHMSPVEAGQRALGFFQLFRWAPGVAFGSSRSAGKYDLDFRRHFRARVGLEAVYVLHLGGLDRRNWRGRVLPAWGQP